MCIPEGLWIERGEGGGSDREGKRKWCILLKQTMSWENSLWTPVLEVERSSIAGANDEDC